MPSGIRATVKFDDPDVCPVAELSAAAGTTVDSVAANVCPDGCAESVTEFSTDADAADPDAGLTPVFSQGSTSRYRLPHDNGVNCPCECIGRFGCPATRYVAREGTLTIAFHAADYDELREVVADLRDRFPTTDIKRFVRSSAEDRTRDRVVLDRSKLTARQLDVLETAYEMGYFDRPRGANATEVAAELGINPSTFREHVAAAETKIFGDFL